MTDETPGVAGPSVAGEVIGGEPPPVPPRAKLGAVGLILLCLVVYLPGFFGVPPTSTEARFAQAARQAYESISFAPAFRDPARHHAIIPHFGEQPLTGTPPLGIWAQAASAAAFTGGNPYRDSIWMYRIPSLVAAIFLVILTRRIGGALFDPAVGRLAAVLVATCPIALWNARLATPDMLGTALICGSLSLLWRGFTQQSTTLPLSLRSSILFWLLLAAATLSAGVIAPLLVALTVGTLRLLSGPRTFTGFRPVLGLPLYAITIALYIGFAARQVGIEPLFGGAIHHLAWNQASLFLPPSIYTITAPLALWPATLLLPAGLVLTRALGHSRGSHASHPGYTFLLAWLIPTWLIIELLPGKTIGLALLLAPPAAIIGARAILAAAALALPNLDSRFTRIGTVTWFISGSALTFTGLSLISVRLLFWPGSTLAAVSAGLISLLGAFIMLRALSAGWRSTLKNKHARAAIAGVGVMAALALLVPTIALPRLLGLPRTLASALEQIDPGASRPIAAVGLSSDPLFFLTRGRLAPLGPSDVPTWFTQNPTGLLIRERTPASTNPLAVLSGFDLDQWRARNFEIVEAPR